jgi:hypothetical protein
MLKSVLRNSPNSKRRPQVAMNPTYFGLLAEIGESEIPLERVCEKYFGLSTPKAKRHGSFKACILGFCRIGRTDQYEYQCTYGNVPDHDLPL